MARNESQRTSYGLAFTFALLVVLGAGWYFKQDISDWYRLRGYTPSAEVVRLADQTTMTDEGRQIFYTTHPLVTGKDDFNAHCRQGNTSEYSIVLGCYVSTGRLYGDVYLYDIDEQRLEGIKQVTAAHEMLHAAYERLSTKERERIDALLLQTYRDLPEGRIKETIAQYEENDPASVPGELHSILGTELDSLPAELEDYYRQYFSDRKAIVRFSEQYEAEFTSRQNQVLRDDAQLAALKVVIETNQKSIDSQRNSLERQRAELNTFESEGNAAAFNARVSNYNQEVAAFNDLVSSTQAKIEEYNQLVTARNDLALEVQELTKAIDSRPEAL